MVEDFAAVLVTKPRPDVRLITLNRPAKLNAINASLILQLCDALDESGADSECRVVVLTGAGRGFCSGLDLGGFDVSAVSSATGKVPAALAVQKAISSLPSRLRALPQPVIAAVNGTASGGGLALVLSSDVRICSATARFNVAYVRIGISGCDVGTSWLLPRIVGVARAQELMLTGRLIDAEEALRIGLVVDVVADADLLHTAMAKAEEIIGNAPLAVSLTKEVMWDALEISGLQPTIDMENRQQVLLGWSEDHPEAVSAFLERRSPRFRNA